jgi:hypothetical protein
LTRKILRANAQLTSALGTVVERHILDETTFNKELFAYGAVAAEHKVTVAANADWPPHIRRMDRTHFLCTQFVAGTRVSVFESYGA